MRGYKGSSIGGGYNHEGDIRVIYRWSYLLEDSIDSESDWTEVLSECGSSVLLASGVSSIVTVLQS